MHLMIDHPFRLLVASFVVLWAAARAGAMLAAWRGPLDQEQREDFNVVLGATLTLLGLIIGFSFSMATSRYDQRKSFEEAEANAIGTAYARANLLPAGAAEQVKVLLRSYAQLRVQDYEVSAPSELKSIEAQTAVAQSKLWAAVVAPATAQPTPVSALAVAAMNDVLNSQGYTQAAWWNRIPAGAWLLLFSISAFASLLIGYGARAALRERILFMILPGVVSISLFLIADIDSPRGGLIRVVPQNLIALVSSLE